MSLNSAFARAEISYRQEHLRELAQGSASTPRRRRRTRARSSWHVTPRPSARLDATAGQH